MTECIFGFNIGPNNAAQGLETDYYQPVTVAGRRPRLMSQNEGGAIAQAQSYGAVCAYRKTGGDYENPRYDNPAGPVAEAKAHWALCYGAKPPEVYKTSWLLCENEPNKNLCERLYQANKRAITDALVNGVALKSFFPTWKLVYSIDDLKDQVDEYVSWFGAYACEMGRQALATGQRYAAFGWASGEPEEYHWERPEMLEYLRMCAAHPDELAVALHEYSYSLDIQNGYPWLVGRFRLLHDVCDRHGIARPTILITEWGWNAYGAPDPVTAMQDIAWAQMDVYGPHPNIKLAAVWTLQGNFDPVKFQVQQLIAPLGAYASGPEFGPPPEPPPPPDPTEIDLAEYLFATEGITTVLQYDIAGQTGTETHQSRPVANPDHDIVMRQKDGRAEYWYRTPDWIGLFLDTSPVQMDGVTKFYTQSTRTPDGDILGAKWIDRVVKVGDVIDRAPVVTWLDYDMCRRIDQQLVADQIRVVAIEDSYDGPGGLTINAPCVTLQWEVGGIEIELYRFVRGLGLVHWYEFNHDWHSYIVEIYDDRPPMDPPSYPACFTPPEAVELYEGDYSSSPAWPSIYKPYRVIPAALRIRTSPSLDGAIIGKIPRGFVLVPEILAFDGGPDDIWVKSGDGWLCARLAGEDYLAPWEPPTISNYLFMPVVHKRSGAGAFTLRWPADFDVVTQAFGANPQIYRRWGLPGHEGIDIAGVGCYGKPIYACAAGRVYLVHLDDGKHNYGTHVRVEHRDGYKTVYAHLVRSVVMVGDPVQAGDIIGYCGSTGNSTGPHLHLTLKREGATAAGDTEYPGDIIDPTPYLRREQG